MLITANNDGTLTAKGVVAFPATLLDVHSAMERSDYREELWQAVKAALAVVASLSLKNRDNCLVLVLEGGSGKGKSVVLRMLYPDREVTRSQLERVDDFTPASFVSHAANRNEKTLKKIDLLPRIKDKVILTKELAPLFRGEERDLRKNFARLTAILDGEGYKSNSGTHGERGYEGQYIFNWLGATTPIPNRTHMVMAQLGNRILFYEVAGDEATEEELMEFAADYKTNDAIKICRSAVNDFVETHFLEHPVASVDPESIAIPEELLRQVVRYSQLIAKGRVEVTVENGTVLETGVPEGAHRIVLLLQMLVRGLALASQRMQVTADDLSMVRHIAFSSLPTKRRELLRAVLAAGGKMEASEVDAALEVSRPTALDRMRELGETGICEFIVGCQRTSTPAEIRLAEPFDWLLAHTPL